jgi:hypothetical protein|tara:strand:- start:234 stop:755 length:522 start_codon:yes stop_codon:yes gene_type:complete
MSKKSRRRNKMLLAGAALFGASKLGMLPGSKTATGITGDKMASAKKAMTSNKAYSPDKFKKAIGPTKKTTAGITKVPESSLKKFSLKKDGSNPTRNMKSIFVQDDGSIIKGTTKYKNKKVYSDAMKKQRGENTDGVKGFLNKFILGEKTKLNKGKMVKARGGGMARSKPTKLY